MIDWFRCHGLQKSEFTEEITFASFLWMLRQSHLFQDAVEQLATQQTETIVAHCAAQPSLSMNSLSWNKPGHSSLYWYTLLNRKRERSQEMKLLETT